MLSDFEKNYTEIKDYGLARDYFNETVRNAEILVVGYKLYHLEQLYNTKGEQSFNDRRTVLINGLGEFYKDFNPAVDQKIFEKLIDIYSKKYPKQFLAKSLENSNGEDLANEVFSKSQLVSYDKIKELLTGDTKTVLEKLVSYHKNVLVNQLLKDHHL